MAALQRRVRATTTTTANPVPITITLEASGRDNLSILRQKIGDIEGQTVLPPIPSSGPLLFLSDPTVVFRLPDGGFVEASDRFGQGGDRGIPPRATHFQRLPKDVRQRLFLFNDMCALASLACTCRVLREDLDDRKLWAAVFRNQGTSSPNKKAARRIFRSFELGGGVPSTGDRFLQRFCTKMQGYHTARCLWKQVVSVASLETMCSFRGPASERDLRAVETAIGHSIPLEVRSSLMVFDGQEVDGPRKGFIHGMPLLSCLQMVAIIRGRPELKMSGLLPLTALSGHKQVVCSVEDGQISLVDGLQCHAKGGNLFEFLSKIFEGMIEPWMR
eukprot:CAMPEP_0114514114 /NCGR_PEP_ID=MMETSP0109-20121206/15965_1 /TAXON_ID=29199 /ORGANISM="Chlorarachnion reptans, Strain CCCM449" /LENGTH=330 /DNA_ID=CAMNT_0001694101 /DNA_START=139 /DNA_END=1131 /DNA_ORIENTATION=+